MISMKIILLICGGVFGFLILIAVLLFAFFWFKGKKKAKFKFLLWSKDGRSVTTIEGIVKIDPNNKKNKQFFFSTNDSSLGIKEPTRWINNEPYREITYDKEGNYIYLKNITLDEGNMKMALAPEEKSIALFRLKETQEKYQNPMEKTQAIMLITGFLMILILIVGIVYATFSFGSGIKHMIDVAELNKESMDIAASITATNADVTVQLVQVTAALTGKTNITRQLS